MSQEPNNEAGISSYLRQGPFGFTLMRCKSQPESKAALVLAFRETIFMDRCLVEEELLH